MGIQKTDPDSATVHEIFSGEVLYRAPLFQRYYVWEDKQLDTLWSDIDTVLEESSTSRFLGALVLKSFQDRSSTKPQGYWIIDGQQRLTTFYLILLACASLSYRYGDKKLATDYVKVYLLAQQSRVENETKLVPTIPDLGQFKEVLTFIDDFHPISPGGNYGNDKGPLIDAFLRILDEIEKRILIDEKVSIERLEQFVDIITNKIEFVQINLADHHDANEVFNRLNDSGQPLEIIDLIRNEVFSLLSSDVKEAEIIYNRHWVDFEKSFDLGKKKEEVKQATKIRNGYFFPFALIKNSSTKHSEVFKNLSNEWRIKISGKNAQDSAKFIIADLKEFVLPYLAFTVGSKLPNICEELWDCIYRLKRMNAPSSLLPYTLKLIKEVEKSNVKEADAIECLNTIESFLVRRAFIGLEPTGLHAVFKGLWPKAKSNSKEVMVNLQTRTVEFPDDQRFRIGIKTSELYKRKLCSYIIEEYERAYTKGDVMKSFPTISIDHIMPQSRDGEWISIISEEDHKKYLHTWANLVPLSIKANSEKGSKSWDEIKQSLKNETVFKTTKKLIDEHDRWSKDEIINRSKVLVKWALIRWAKLH